MGTSSRQPHVVHPSSLITTGSSALLVPQEGCWCPCHNPSNSNICLVAKPKVSLNGEIPSRPRTIVLAEVANRSVQDCLDACSSYSAEIPELELAVLVKIFPRRRIDMRFACLFVMMRRDPASEVATVTDTVSFGSCPLSIETIRTIESFQDNVTPYQPRHLAPVVASVDPNNLWIGDRNMLVDIRKTDMFAGADDEVDFLEVSQQEFELHSIFREVSYVL
ncbi:hypothetical protein FI667_g10344, partial [Globisporangium splendens]